jgi:hypothetical protein
MIDDTVILPPPGKAWRFPGKAHSFIALSLILPVGGCLTYSTQELSAMSGVRLCEMQLYSRVNLKDDAKRLLQDELRKRNEDCRKYVAQLEQERAEERETAMYNLTAP